MRRFRAGSRAVLCSIGAGPHAQLLEIARPSLQAWAERFGYDLDLRYEVLDASRPPAWSKIVLLRQRIESHRCAVWVDADAVVVDVNGDLSTLVDRRRPLAMVAHHYGGMTVPNTGILAIRSTPVTRRLLEQLWSMTQYVDHKWWENAAMLDLLGYDISAEPIVKTRESPLERRITWLDTAWNSIDLDPSPAPYIRHFPGLSNDERARRMAEIARNHRASPVNST